MSVQFGKWSFDGPPPSREFLDRVNALLAPYGPDNGNSYQKDGVSIIYRAFHTTKESRRETQPYICESGAVITWDGRLDNREELIHLLNDSLSIDSTDVSILSAAYERWGTDCFAKLIGDWSLSIWDPNERSLILAKDPVGARHLYYSVENNQVTWSTILDPLVLCAEKTFGLKEEYIAGWFSFLPAAHLTPYVGIDSVPPSCFARLEPGRKIILKYWDFDPGKKVRYHRDADYEEHFRTVFAEAVRRRLRSDSPILAELSGGMDSSSIVCMADTIITRRAADTPRLDTLSYYADSEPNWNEFPYFTKVEEQRGRTGCHIDVGTQRLFSPDTVPQTFAATPGSRGGQSTKASLQFAACMASQGNRVLLSGIGGDEVTGGVPTPTPQLMDLLARARFKELAHQLKVWALNKRKPWFHLLFEATREFFPSAIAGVPKHIQPPSWLYPDFVRRYRAALTGYRTRVKLFGPLPSFQENLSTLNSLRRKLACSALPSAPPYEKRYPYLDRDLLEFMYAVPREQLVRPGQRRSLMRRALIGIVPDELLNRKRKAFVVRGPITAISAEWGRLMDLSQHMISGSMGIVEPHSYRELLRKAHEGQEVQIVTLLRALGVEFWLKALSDHGLMKGGSPTMLHPSDALRNHAELAKPLPQKEFS